MAVAGFVAACVIAVVISNVSAISARTTRVFFTRFLLRDRVGFMNSFD
jgi:hypothetical protein